MHYSDDTTAKPPLSRTEATALLGEVEALRRLVQELAGRTGPLAPPARGPRLISGGIDPALPAGQLAQALWEALGRRRCMWLRTKLCQLAEAEDGVRSRGRGRDRV